MKARTTTVSAVLWGLLLGLAVCTQTAWARPPLRDLKRERAAADALFTNAVLHTLRLEISQDGMAALRRDHRKPVLATLREGDRVYSDVAVHLKGSAGSLRGLDDKPGFTLNFTRFESGERFHGLRKFHLNNSVQDGTYLSDQFASDLFRAAGVPSARTAHAVVELNGRKLGLYVILEAMDRDFLAQYFQETRGNLFGQQGGCEITDRIDRMEGSGPLDYAPLRRLAAAVQQQDRARRWEQMRKTLDLDRFLSFMAVEVMLCDWDGYTFARHNYRVYHDVDTDRIVFLPHDKDQIMGDPNVPIVPGVNGIVAQAVLNTPEARVLYRQRIEEVFTNHFQLALLTNRLSQVVNSVAVGLKAYNPNLALDFVNNANSLKDRIINRSRSLARQFHPPPPKKKE